MGKVRRLISGLTGAGLMYFLDPNMGRSRRALLRDQLVKLRHRMFDRTKILAEQATDRVQGAVAQTVGKFAADDVSNETLVARVRSEMGRYISHPHAVDVMAYAGIVTLTGNILAHEVQPFIVSMKSIPGVRRVENQLQAHEDAGNIPDLQGGKIRTELL